MIAYPCERCGQFTIKGFINEYKEYFCSEECYKWHCLLHGTEVNLEKLKQLD